MTRVVILEPRSSGCALIERASELGLQAIVVTRHEPPTVPDEQLGYAHEILYVDTTNNLATLRAIRALHRAEAIDAIVPGFEHQVPLAAFLATDLGLPGMGCATARRVRDKYLMRKAVSLHEIDQPRHLLVRDGTALAAATWHIGFPCVIKPVDQSGSLGVKKAHNPTEAALAFDAIQDRLGQDAPAPVLVEEYADGPELSVEGYVSDGIVHVLGLTEKHLGPEPDFVELGHLVPAPLSASASALVVDYATRVVHALGLTIGPFHLELRLTGRGPLLMEIGARLPGDRIPDLLRYANGADLYEATLRSYLRQPPLAASLHRPRHAGIRYVMQAGLSTFSGMRVDSHVRRHPSVIEVGSLMEPGTPVVQKACSSARVAYALVVAADAEATCRALDVAINGLHLGIDPPVLNTAS